MHCVGSGSRGYRQRVPSSFCGRGGPGVGGRLGVMGFGLPTSTAYWRPSREEGWVHTASADGSDDREGWGGFEVLGGAGHTA
eukprot:687486-Prymnesium_polylepis.1